MRPQEHNYAFIDSQNLNLSIQELGWKLDFTRFRKYLTDKYSIEKAFLFIGYEYLAFVSALRNRAEYKMKRTP